MKIIDKIAWIYLKEGKILATLSKGKDTYYIPGGKKEGNETDEETLEREIRGRIICSNKKRNYTVLWNF